jgi:hypothetical protein
MDIIFDLGTLLEIFKHYGTFLGCITALAMLLMKYIIQNWSKWRGGNINDETLNSKNRVVIPEDIEEEEQKLLRTNAFFTKAQYRMMIEIPRLDLIPHKPVREKVFKDILIISFQTVYDSMHVFVENQLLGEWTPEQWTDALTQSVNMIVVTSSEHARQQGIPEIAIRKFSKWYSETIEQLREYILLLASAKLYHTNVTKTNTFLMVMDLLLESILGDVERVISEINGDLTGLPYKGMIVE